MSKEEDKCTVLFAVVDLICVTQSTCNVVLFTKEKDCLSKENDFCLGCSKTRFYNA